MLIVLKNPPVPAVQYSLMVTIHRFHRERPVLLPSARRAGMVGLSARIGALGTQEKAA
jgi:hypothetical protein